MRTLIRVACVLSALAVLALTAPQSAAAVSPGFQGTFSTAGLQQFEAAIIAYINAHFQDISLPDMSLQPHVPILGKVDLDLKNIVITGFQIPGATFTTHPPDSVDLTISGTTLTTKLDWHWRQHDWPHISDHGSLTAEPKQGDIGATVSLTVVNQHPYLTATSTTCNFDKVELHFSGHWDSWLYNLFADLFSHAIKDAVDSAVAKALSGIVDDSLNKELAKLKTELYFGGGKSRMDLDIAFSSFASSASYLSFANDFAVADNSTGAACPIAPVALPVLDPQSHQIQFFVAQSTLNCFLWVLYTNNALNLNLPSKTSDWTLFIPQLPQMYPGDAMTLVLTPLGSQPMVSMTGSGVTATLDYSMEMDVTVSGSSVYACTLGFSADLGLDIWVGPGKTANVTAALYANVTQIQLDVSVIKSSIGSISVAGLQLLIDAVEPIAQGVINDFLEAGIPLPLPGIGLDNPQILFGTGYVGVAADFHLTPSQIGLPLVDADAVTDDA